MEEKGRQELHRYLTGGKSVTFHPSIIASLKAGVERCGSWGSVGQSCRVQGQRGNRTVCVECGGRRGRGQGGKVHRRKGRRRTGGCWGGGYQGFRGVRLVSLTPPPRRRRRVPWKRGWWTLSEGCF